MLKERKETPGLQESNLKLLKKTVYRGEKRLN
jgi:hypothetical protein